MGKKNEKAGSKKRNDSRAESILEEARPLLIRALLKCGKIPTEPPPGGRLADSLLCGPAPVDYEFFRLQQQQGEMTWLDLRRKVDAVACKLADLAHRRGLDPFTALRSAVIMRIAPEYPLTDTDAASIFDLMALVSLLGGTGAEGSFDVFDPQTSNDDAKVLEILKKAYPGQVKFGTLTNASSCLPSAVREERSLNRRLNRLIDARKVGRGDRKGYYVWIPPQ